MTRNVILFGPKTITKCNYNPDLVQFNKTQKWIFLCVSYYNKNTQREFRLHTKILTYMCFQFRWNFIRQTEVHLDKRSTTLVWIKNKREKFVWIKNKRKNFIGSENEIKEIQLIIFRLTENNFFSFWDGLFKISEWILWNFEMIL